MAIESIRVNEGAANQPPVAVDDVSGNNFQVVKVALGADGAFDTLVDSGQQTASASFPVVIASDQTKVATTLQDSTGDSCMDDTNNALRVNVIAGGGGGTQYTEDVASAGGESLTLAGTIRQDTPTGSTSTDGDYQNLKTDSVGRLWVNASGAAVPVTDNGSTLSIDDGASSITVDGTVTANLAAGTNNIGDIDVLSVPAPLSTTGSGTEATALRVTIATDSTGVLSVDDNGSSLTVDGSVSITGAVDTELPAAAALADNTSNPTVPAVGAFSMVYDGSTWDRTPGTSTDGTLVNLGANNDVTASQTGTWTVQPGNTANTTPWLASIHDGTTKATVRDLSSNDALNVAIVDGSGAQITSFGGGTQYTEADVDTTITGTAVMWEDTSDTLRVASAAKPLPVTIISGAGNGGTSMTDDAAFTPATSGITPMGAFFDDVTPDPVNEGDGGCVRMSANRNLYATLRDAAGNERGVNVNASNQLSVSVDNTAAVTATGNVAHDAVDSGNPVKVGAVAQTSLPTAVANADRANIISDQFGRLLFDNCAPGMQTWKRGAYTTTQTGTAIWTPAAGKKIAIQYVSISTSGTTTATLHLWFGASADTTYTAGTDQLLFTGYFSPSASAKPGAILQGPTLYAATADYILRITTSAALTVDIVVYGFEF